MDLITRKPPFPGRRLRLSRAPTKRLFIVVFLTLGFKQNLPRQLAVVVMT